MYLRNDDGRPCKSLYVQTAPKESMSHRGSCETSRATPRRRGGREYKRVGGVGLVLASKSTTHLRALINETRHSHAFRLKSFVIKY